MMEPKPPKKDGADTYEEVDLSEITSALPSQNDSSDTEDDFDLDATSYYLPSRKNLENRYKDLNPNRIRVSNESPPVQKTLKLGSLPEPPPQLAVPDQVPREVPERKNTPLGPPAILISDQLPDETSVRKNTPRERPLQLTVSDPLPREAPIQRHALRERPLQLTIPDQLPGEVPLRRNTPQPADDILRPTEFELPSRPLSLNEDTLRPVVKDNTGRKRVMRSVRYGVLIGLSLGTVGLAILSFWTTGSRNNAATVVPSGEQATKTVLPQRIPVSDNKSDQTENLRVPATTPINVRAEGVRRGTAPETEPFAALPSGEQAAKSVLPPSTPVSDQKGDQKQNKDVPLAAASTSAQAEDIGKQIAPQTGPLSPERAAVDSLILGRSDQAIALYDELARKHTDQPAYSAIAKILKRRAEERCIKGTELGDPSCNQFTK